MIPELDGVLTASPNWQQLTAPADAAGAEAAVRAERELLDRITAGRYDVMLVFTSFSQSPWPVAHLGLLAGIGTRVVHSREFAGAVATHWVTPPPDTTHHVDRSLHLVEAIGVPLQGRTPSLRIPASAYADADDLLADALAGRSADHRTAGETVRMRAMAGATTATTRLPRSSPGSASARPRGGSPCSCRVRRARRGATRPRGSVRRRPRSRPRVCRSWWPAPRPRPASSTRSCAAAGAPDVRALPAVGLPVFTALIARAAVALTNNSGGLHLAEATGTPVVVTYAGTERLGDVAPRAVPCALLQVPVPCSPCRQLSCPFHLECLDVAPQRLADAALRLAAHGTAGPATAPSGVPAPDDPPSDIPVSGIPEEDRWLHIPTPWIA